MLIMLVAQKNQCHIQCTYIKLSKLISFLGILEGKQVSAWKQIGNVVGKKHNVKLLQGVTGSFLP